MAHFPRPHFQVDEAHVQTSGSCLSVLGIEAGSYAFSLSRSDDDISSDLYYARSYGDNLSTIPTDSYTAPYPPSTHSYLQPFSGPCNDSNHYTDFSAQYQQPASRLSIISEAGVSNTSQALEICRDVVPLTQIRNASGLAPLRIPKSFNQSSETDSAYPGLSEGVQSQGGTPNSASSSVTTPISSALEPWNGFFPFQEFLNKDEVMQELGNSLTIGDKIVNRPDVYSSARDIVPSCLEQASNVDHSRFAGDLIHTSNEGIRRITSRDHSNMQNGRYVHLVTPSTDFMAEDTSAGAWGLNVNSAAVQPQISNWQVATKRVKRCALLKRKTTGRYFCEFCPADFTARHNLKNHLNSHIGRRPFSCVQCSYRSGTSCTLKRHVSKKHGEAATPESKG
ncbi:hypothetical protein VKT23_006464 [Stygiomarasmius scandens]|uniref:C2H2-type domain-containing protein n=1 Tax=Marasmiellus scandens TaxID=2682957 RepID=A0ABR1JPX3_9AGAR